MDQFYLALKSQSQPRDYFLKNRKVKFTVTLKKTLYSLILDLSRRKLIESEVQIYLKFSNF